MTTMSANSSPEHLWNTLVLTFSTSMDLSTSLSLTIYPRCWSFTGSLYDNKMIQRQYLSWRSYLNNTEFYNLYAPTMTHNLQMHYLLNLPQIRRLITTWVLPGILEVMAKQKLLWRLSKGFSPMLWLGSIPSYPSIPQHTHWCTPALSRRSSVPTGLTYYSTTVYTKQRSKAAADCDCLDECASQSAKYNDNWGCRKKSSLFAGFCTQWCQDSLASCHCHLWCQQWLIPCTGCWWRTVQKCSRWLTKIISYLGYGLTTRGYGPCLLCRRIFIYEKQIMIKKGIFYLLQFIKTLWDIHIFI